MVRAQPSRLDRRRGLPGQHHDRVFGPYGLTLTVEEAATALGISRAFAYEAVARGENPCIRTGKRILVPIAGLNRLLEGA